MRCVTGTWYENGQLVPSHNIARRPAAYQPFESVPPYPGAPVQQPSTFDGNPEYPHRAAPGEECGYPTIQEWESARPRRPIDRGAALPYETTRMEVFGVENGVSRLTTGNQFDENYWNDQPATSGRNPNPASGANTAQQPPQRSQTLPSYNTQGGFQAGGGYPAPNVQQAQTSHQASDPRQDSLQHNNTFPQAPGQPGHPAQPAHRPIPPAPMRPLAARPPAEAGTLRPPAPRPPPERQGNSYDDYPPSSQAQDQQRRPTRSGYPAASQSHSRQHETRQYTSGQSPRKRYPSDQGRYSTSSSISHGKPSKFRK